jgi:hypothetical protein
MIYRRQQQNQLLYKAIFCDLYCNVSTYFTAPIKTSYKVINLVCNVFGSFSGLILLFIVDSELMVLNAIFAR